ncbi:NAD-specific glutamate dehydrogenase [compost metagenome]
MAGLPRLLVEPGGAAVDAVTMLLAGVEQGHVDFQQAVDVIAEAHIQALDAAIGRELDIEGVDKDIVTNPGPLPLVHLDPDHFLLGMGTAEALDPGRRDHRVAFDDRRKHTADFFAASSTDPQRVRTDIGQDQLFNGLVAGLAGRLGGGPQRDDGVRVQVPVWQAAEQGGNHLLHRRHTRGAAHQHQAVEVLGAHPGVAQRLLDRCPDTRQQPGPDFQRAGFIQ